MINNNISSIKKVDIHQHLNFWGRSDEDFLAHQKAIGAYMTILLPSDGITGLNGGGYPCSVSDTAAAYEFCEAHEGFIFGANAPWDSPTLQADLAAYLDKGAKLIGELKYGFKGNSPHLWKYAEVAQSYNVPLLLHFQQEYGFSLEDFEETLQRFPKVIFIGHATQWWAEMMDLTTKLMESYPNLYGDLSASSALQALKAQEDAISFLTKYQDRLFFGTDCQDPFRSAGGYPGVSHCTGLAIAERISNLVDKSITTKILRTNAEQLFSLKKG